MIVQPGQWALTKIMLHLVGLQSIIIITVIMVYIVIVIMVIRMVIMMVIVMVYDGV
jgi:hypothetical protein